MNCFAKCIKLFAMYRYVYRQSFFMILVGFLLCVPANEITWVKNLCWSFCEWLVGLLAGKQNHECLHQSAKHPRSHDFEKTHTWPGRSINIILSCFSEQINGIFAHYLLKHIPTISHQHLKLNRYKKIWSWHLMKTLSSQVHYYFETKMRNGTIFVTIVFSFFFPVFPNSSKFLIKVISSYLSSTPKECIKGNSLYLLSYYALS